MVLNVMIPHENDVIVDAFYGTEGNTVRFAFTCQRCIYMLWSKLKFSQILNLPSQN